MIDIAIAAMMALALLPSPQTPAAAATAARAVVARLYQEFAAEAVIDTPELSIADLFGRPRAALARYLDEPLVALVMADRACSQRTQEVCNLDFAPIWDSQDPVGVTVTIDEPRDPARVPVELHYPKEPARRLTYVMVKTPAGWRIHDIEYDSHESLVAMLRKKGGQMGVTTPEGPARREIHTVAREAGALPDRWTPATPGCDGVPPFHVHEYTPTFFILRQSGCTNFEKPFLYLILGTKEALLVDTGAKGADVSAAVDDVLRRHAASQHATELPLLVVHSHGHSDHVAADASFRHRPATRVIEGKVDAVSSFFSIPDWPSGTAGYDLGERVLDVVPIPGHEPASIAIYDRRTGILLTGDTLYPGRLYVRDEAAFRASIDRLVEFTATREVAHVLGAHIENTRTPFVDYPEGTTYQPDEHPLELGRAHLLELQAALRATPGPLERRALRDFTIWPVNGH